MNPVLIAALILVAVIIVMAAFALYKAGFKVDKIKAKLPVVEMEASRPVEDSDAEDEEAGPKIRQRAKEGGTISESGITAPAESSAEIDQQATGEKSKIDDSPIKLT
jgi:hypothetical protein